MPNCSAINCSNRSEKGFRLFAFPANVDRRALWVQNMQRASWQPTRFSKLCEEHFDKSQFESKRADGWKKLKPNAVPTLFDVPNKRPVITVPHRKAVYKRIKKQAVDKTQYDTLTLQVITEKVEHSSQQLAEASALIRKLKHENSELQQKLKNMEALMQTILNKGQIKCVTNGRVSEWENENIVKAMKIHFALSDHDYE